MTKGDDYLIYSSSVNGPAFGYGLDIFITDRCNDNRESGANFPTTYNRASGKKLGNNKETHHKFAGDRNFRVLEYEVFKLWFS